MHKHDKDGKCLRGGVDWDRIKAGCPRCGKKLQWHSLTVWCLSCGWGKNWDGSA